MNERTCRVTRLGLAVSLVAFVLGLGAIAGGCSDVGDDTGVTPDSDAASGLTTDATTDAVTSDSGGEKKDATSDTGRREAESDSTSTPDVAEDAPSEVSQEIPDAAKDVAEDVPSDVATDVADAEIDTSNNGGGDVSTDVTNDVSTVVANDSSNDVSAEVAADVSTDVGSTVESGPPPPPPLVPCTTVAQANDPVTANCVTCNQNTNGVCTPTEAIFVGIDIGTGAVTTAGPPPESGCYMTMSNDGCIDSEIDSSPQTSGAECGDLGTASFTAGNGFVGTVDDICVATLNCTAGFGQPGYKATCLGPSTATISTCLCGTDHEPAATCQGVSSISLLNGVCATFELDGYPASLTTPSTLVGNFTTSTFPSGTANSIAQCAVGNTEAKVACNL
jgi:hypothetical protein